MFPFSGKFYLEDRDHFPVCGCGKLRLTLGNFSWIDCYPAGLFFVFPQGRRSLTGCDTRHSVRWAPWSGALERAVLCWMCGVESTICVSPFETGSPPIWRGGLGSVKELWINTICECVENGHRERVRPKKTCWSVRTDVNVDNDWP